MDSKKVKKGEMLVETVIAMTIFTIIMAVSFAAYKSFSNISNKTEDYVNLETICYDIDKYYDYYGKDFWAENYFGDKYSTNCVEKYDLYYNLMSSTATNHAYELDYHYDGDNLIVSIKNVKDGDYIYDEANDTYYRTGTYVIKDLNYGESLASSTSGDISYYEAVKANNRVVRIKKDNGGEESDGE